jgi:hypothetical protein
MPSNDSAMQNKRQRLYKRNIKFSKEASIETSSHELLVLLFQNDKTENQRKKHQPI